MAAPFVSVDIDANTDNSIGSFPYNNRIVEVKKTKMKYKIIIGVVAFCLLAGGATAAGIIISKNKDGSSTPNDPVDPDNPPDGPYLYEQPPFTPKDGFEAMWWDEFDGDEIDRSKWYVQPDVIDYYTTRRELEHYIDDPTTVDVYNGTLSIIANNSEGVQYDEKNPNYDQTYYTSARINTNSTVGNWNPGMFVDNSTWSTVRIEAERKSAV